MERKRIKIGGKQLATVIRVWLLHVPAWMWGKDPAYERLRAQKRHDPSQEPDARGVVSEHIAAEIERLGWEVSYPEPVHPAGAPVRKAPAEPGVEAIESGHARSPGRLPGAED